MEKPLGVQYLTVFSWEKKGEYCLMRIDKKYKMIYNKFYHDARDKNRMRYRLVGRLSFRDELAEKTYEAEVRTVSNAIREALLQAQKSEKTNPEPFDGRKMRHFTLSVVSEKGEKIILTVYGEGQSWSDCILDAYLRVCAWQGQEAEIPEELLQKDETHQKERKGQRIIGKQ